LIRIFLISEGTKHKLPFFLRQLEVNMLEILSIYRNKLLLRSCFGLKLLTLQSL